MTDKDYTGIVKWYNAPKRFGFISYDDGDINRDCFFHINDVMNIDDRVPMISDEVTFNIVLDSQGRSRALNVYVSETTEEKEKIENE